MASTDSRSPHSMHFGAMDVALSVNSIVASAASTAVSAASKMLMSIASPCAAAGEVGSWRPVDYVRHMLMFIIWGNVWVLQFLTDTFPSPPRTGLSLTFDIGMFSSPRGSSSSALVARGGQLGGSAVSMTAIGRALTHMLGVLNEIPAGSRKYEYVLAMADRLVSDNLQSGNAALLDVNRAALATAFTRTCDLLRRSLQYPNHSCFASTSSPFSPATWPSRVVSLLPPGPRQIYDGLRLCLNGFFPSTVDGTMCRLAYKPQRHAAITTGSGAAYSSGEWLEAEKLAHELLWITNKLRASSAGYEAVARWASASGLASLALIAHPRVQGPIVKTTVLLIRELEQSEWEVARDVRFGLLALWLPVLYYASSGVTSPVVDGAERWETERALEELIDRLPADDQEVIFRNWLEDFAASDSDWPNLHRCFDRWCRSSRKQLLLL